MDTRIIGKNGPKVAVVGLGCNNFGGRLDLDATRKVVHKALDLGITLFDTADVYGGYGYGNYGGRRSISARPWARAERISCSPASSAWR